MAVEVDLPPARHPAADQRRRDLHDAERMHHAA